MNQDNKDITCFCCGKKGHYSDNCPDKEKIPKEEWAVKKGMNLHQRKEQEKKDDEEEENDDEYNDGWMTIQFDEKLKRKKEHL